ncbi:MAG TPA: VOC family protein [Candidatus Tectomicrobia bacterium]|nr:VOC family protein [Candidatus Tectomicrobia bacterium]
MAKPIPDGYHSVTPYLTVDDAGRALDFYTRALGGQELMRMAGPGGRVMHAEVKIGDSIVMLGEESADKPDCRAPRTARVRSASFYVYVPDVDKAFARARDAGATVVAEPVDMFWGDRIATVEDPAGHQWTLATHREDVSPEEMGRRQQQYLASMGQARA